MIVRGKMKISLDEFIKKYAIQLRCDMLEFKECIGTEEILTFIIMYLKENENKEKNIFTENIIKQIDKLDDESRVDIFDCYCKHCGTKNPSCRCWDDS